MGLLWNALDLIGGLAMFLFGMNVMGEGLERRAGDRLKEMLERMTSSPFRGLLLGILTTAAIQSSSAVTVMVVGFVNSGVMSLRRSISVIMGANVGTTLTAWLLATTGIRGDTLLLQMLKLTSFAPILGTVGVVLYVFRRDGRHRALGAILLGFTVLIYGMEKMSGAVKPLSEIPEFGNFLLLFETPLFGVLAGAILTAILQSSSASIGILQALCATGQVTLAAAVPIVMGQNIGTCATSLLSSVGTSCNARRAAMVHLYFNLFGTLIQLTAFYLLNGAIGFDFLSRAADPASIATVHSVFNVLSTLLLFPLSGAFEKMVIATVREKRKAAQ